MDMALSILSDIARAAKGIFGLSELSHGDCFVLGQWLYWRTDYIVFGVWPVKDFMRRRFKKDAMIDFAWDNFHV